MLSYGWLNLGSLVLGLIAWILPFVGSYRNRAAFSLMSMSACAVSLCFQIFYINHKVNVADWSALMDTMGAVAAASAVLLIVTVLLNVFALIVFRERTEK